MRTATRQYSVLEHAATESFGRIARVIAPAPRTTARTSANEPEIRPGAAGFKLTAHALHAAARVQRSRWASDLLARALRAVRERVSAWRNRSQQRALARATYRALSELDERTLRDLGLSRSELAWTASDIASPAATRARQFLP